MSEFPQELLERYEYLDPIGSGAMGLVYLARDRVLEKEVAIKMLSGKASTRSRLVRFQKEARAAAKLNHENIIKVFDFGVMKNGDPYMVMEYLEGKSLKEFLEGNDSDDPLVLIDFCAQIASAMHHAHGQGIVHRDLKSDNIMITQDPVEGSWRAQIIDFGIAHLGSLDMPEGFESTGNAIVGSPCYISPESIRADRVDGRADIYSLGCVLFEALCGDVPFRGSDPVSTMEMHMKLPPPPVVPESRFGLDGDQPFVDKVEGVIKRALAKDPGRRYPSMRYMEEDLLELKQILSDERARKELSERESEREESAPSLEFNHLNGSILSRGRLKVPVLLIVTVSLLALPVVGWAYYKSSIVGEKINHDMAKSTNSASDSLSSLAPLGLSIGDFDYSKVTDDDVLSGKYKTEGSSTIILKFSAIGDRGVAALDLTGIKKINLDDTKITDKSMKVLSKVPTLQEVYVDETAVTDKGVYELAALPHLKIFKCERIGITDDGIKCLSALPQLNTLDVGLCEGITLKSVEYLKKMPRLSALRISKTAIKPRHLKGFKNLHRLSCEFSSLSQEDIEAILSMTSLKRLTLTGSNLTGDQLMSFARLPHLEMLMLSGCRHISEAQVDRFNAKRDRVFIQTILPYKKTYPRNYSYRSMLKANSALKNNPDKTTSAYL